MKNIIIGSGNLSNKLKEQVGGVVVPASEIDQFFSGKIDGNINIILNQFQQSTKLYDITDPNNYIAKSIVSTSKILGYIKNKNLKVNKIIYTSSSSIYGDNPSCKESDNPHPKSLHSSLKWTNEKLIEMFCKENSIDYTVTRIFNMYGGDDGFSIVSKIIDSYKNNLTLTLINNGESIRDYIFIDDVVYIYKKILETKNLPLLNIGTSEGKSVLFILNYLKQKNIEINTINLQRDELKVSISENKFLLDLLGRYSFKKVENFIYGQLV